MAGPLRLPVTRFDGRGPYDRTAICGHYLCDTLMWAEPVGDRVVAIASGPDPYYWTWVVEGSTITWSGRVEGDLEAAVIAAEAIVSTLRAQEGEAWLRRQLEGLGREGL